jgi:hypothetical protein
VRFDEIDPPFDTLDALLAILLVLRLEIIMRV